MSPGFWKWLYFRGGLAHLVGAMTWFWRKQKQYAVLAAVWQAGLALAGAAESLPLFQEVRDLVKTNLMEMDGVRLDRAAAEGLLRELAPLVSLVTNQAASAREADTSALSKSWVYEGAFGYLRVGGVGRNLVKELGMAMDAMADTNKIKGWVLDLRFADGSSYVAAAGVADRFVAREQPLLDCGQGVIRSQAKENPIKVPVMVLVNRETSQAAEALAAILRKTESALLLGTNTAGQAFVTKEFPLRDGRSLRIATSWVKIGQGEAIPRQGVKPDILVAVNPADERAYFLDPYRALAKVYPPVSASAATETNLVAGSTNRSSRHRLNEAELVRMLREGEEYDGDGFAPRPADTARAVLRDPVLARAVDLLKGLAMVRRVAGP